MSDLPERRNLRPAAAARLRQHDYGDDQGDELQAGRRKKGGRESVALHEHPTENGSENDARTERGADVRKRLAALRRLDEVGDVGLSDAEIPPGNALDDARDKNRRDVVREG